MARLLQGVRAPASHDSSLPGNNIVYRLLLGDSLKHLPPALFSLPLYCYLSYAHHLNGFFFLGVLPPTQLMTLMAAGRAGDGACWGLDPAQPLIAAWDACGLLLQVPLSLFLACFSPNPGVGGP